MKFATLGLVLFIVANADAQRTRHPGPPSNNGMNVFPFTDGDPLATVQVRSTPPPVTALAEPISVGQLRVPSKASKEYQRALKAFQSGDCRNSIEHSEKAVQIYPDFLQAHDILGICKTRAGKYEQAVAEFDKAISINPNMAQGYHNLSVALYHAQRYQDAEFAARHALQLDSHRISSQYVLGRSLLAQHKYTPEAVDALRQSSATFSNARLFLALILFRQGDVNQVVAELRDYLKAPDADQKPKASCWLAELTKAPVPANCAALRNSH
jgi:tetratricopeptide (TPR) repeat protein